MLKSRAGFRGVDMATKDTGGLLRDAKDCPHPLEARRLHVVSVTNTREGAKSGRDAETGMHVSYRDSVRHSVDQVFVVCLLCGVAETEGDDAVPVDAPDVGGRA
jgi:hypothetical protein